MCDNKKFWKSISPLFSNKVRLKEKIALVESNETKSNDAEIAKVFKNYF